MANHSVRIIVVCLVLLLVLGSFGPTPTAEAAWDCKETVPESWNDPITGGTISGRGCKQVVGDLSWEVWGDTTLHGGSGTWVYTKAIGYDSCDYGGYRLQMSTEHYDGPSVLYGTSGTATGGFQSCYQVHNYKVEGWHEANRNGWEGYSGSVYW